MYRRCWMSCPDLVVQPNLVAFITSLNGFNAKQKSSGEIESP